MHDFSDFSTSEIYNALEKDVEQFEEETGAKALCGQIGGGRSMGLSNKASDNDFDIYYVGGRDIPFKRKIVSSICGCDVEIEYNYCKMDELLNAANDQIARTYNGYPTCFYRNEEDNEKYSPKNIKLRWERDDYYFTKFHWIMMSDDVWVRKDWVSEYYKLYQKEKKIDAVDYYYIRAYGNWNNYIKDHEQINHRRYLNSIWQMMSCEWIVKYSSRPIVNFEKLVHIMAQEKELKEITLRYLDSYRIQNEDKSKVSCDTNRVIDLYIEKSLNKLKNKIETMDENKSIETLISSNTEELKRHIYLYSL